LAGQEKKTSLLTFGGPWSNHIVATAFAAREQGLASMGIIRGEPAVHRTATLEEAAGYGMTFQFLGRSLFRAARADGFRSFAQEYPEHLVIPEGGAGEPGALGAERILDDIDKSRYTHIACACGTGTMMAGLVRAAGSHQQVWGIDVVGQGPALERSIRSMLPDKVSPAWRVIQGFERGGYARHDGDLLEFMGRFHEEQGIPSDIVYTGKLFLAIDKLLEKSPLPLGCRLLAIHSGGLQGNRSLAPGTISF
jgi:1-aminocyclopropane-1-carboxylate deaminase